MICLASKSINHSFLEELKPLNILTASYLMHFSFYRNRRDISCESLSLKIASRWLYKPAQVRDIALWNSDVAYSCHFNLEMLHTYFAFCFEITTKFVIYSFVVILYLEINHIYSVFYFESFKVSVLFYYSIFKVRRTLLVAL